MKETKDAASRPIPLVKGGVLSGGFEILDVRELPELKAEGIWVRHQKTGAEVFHVYNDDPENLFAFAFATAPEDDTGAAHILEHSVLCGSQRYPLKDAFLVLAQGSLQTFLNAWTFPDRTVYPASSVNERDYFNLMSVYGDAVFQPLLSEFTFMQEGWRFLLPEGGAAPGTGLSLTGVVYNEMKGAYSSLDAYAGLWSVKAVLPSTPYAFESGGDPAAIPGLSWEALRAFHRRCYSPANCRIFLAGNIPTEKQLDFLDSRFFSSFSQAPDDQRGKESGEKRRTFPKAERWKAPREFRVPCPSGAEEKATVFLSWLCGDVTDTAETLALGTLAEILLGHDGSPLVRALVESGLGEDLAPVSGFESEIRETVFVAGLRGCAGRENIRSEVKDLVLGELERLVNEGIPKEDIEAALLSMEFSHREIKRGGGPYSLVWMRCSLRGWMYGSKPWESLLFVPPFEEIKRRLALDGRYFETLIKKYLLDNPHRALLSIEPEADYLEKEESRFAAQLAEKERSLGGEERRRIAEKAAALEKAQGEGDSPEALAAIPHLSRGDLSPRIDPVPRAFRNAGGVPVAVHELFTNGIVYVDAAFPVDVLSPEEYPWLPFFSRAVVSMGLKGMDYGEVSGLLARNSGGFYSMLHTGSAAPKGTPEGAGPAVLTAEDAGVLGRDWIIFRLKALDEKVEASLDLALRLITGADFSDERRVRDLVLEMKNDVDAGFAHSGHSYASSRSGCFFSRARAVEEIWSGLYQLDFVHTLAGMDTAEITRKLFSIRDAVAGRAGLMVNLTGEARALEKTAGLIARDFGRFGPPRPVLSPAGGDPFFALLAAPGAPPEKDVPLVFASPSLQVGFAALSLPASPWDTPPEAAEIVLAHELSTGALWETVRMKGGAYGAFAQSDSLEGIFSLASYRDPNPAASLEAFVSALKNTGGTETGDDLVKAIIGCYARETRPRTPCEKGFLDFLRFLYGIDGGARRRRLERLIALSDGEFAGARRNLAAAGASFPVVLAGTKTAEKAAAKLGAALRELPV
ncbi:MAG: insulinase family protein [Treponema sp.]|jgi:Zn-dependent M16 (insulinase) family peptidase|nr:insulinase family protein [Treponema sp.]